MTKAEMRTAVLEHKETADRLIRGQGTHQTKILVAMSAKEMADWLLQIFQGEKPWD